MKTTLEIPDELLRAAKEKAALQGCELKDLVTDGLRLVLAPSSCLIKQVSFPIIKRKGHRVLNIPDDIASQVELREDLERHETPLR
jgi:hypothetical protein